MFRGREKKQTLKNENNKTPSTGITQSSKKLEEKEQPIKNAIVKGVVVGFVTAVMVAAALAFTTALSVIEIAAGSVVVGGIIGVVIYMMSNPKTEMEAVKQELALKRKQFDFCIATGSN